MTQGKTTPPCLSFSPEYHGGMTHGERTREMISLVRARYRFDGKVGVAMCCADGDEANMPPLVGVHRVGDDIASFEIPASCDFCMWLSGFANEVKSNRGATESKLAEASFRCKTMFFSSGLARPVEETVLRHTRYERAVEVGRVDGQPVYMCW